MWGALHFFVSMDVLVSLDFIDEKKLDSKPGRPYQRVMDSTEDGTLVGVTAYPNAILFLQTLRATGNRIHIISRWSKAHTERVVSVLEWGPYVFDVRSVRAIPGVDRFTMTSIGCDPAWYANSVLVVPDAGEWHPLLAQQIVAVDHAASARQSTAWDASDAAACTVTLSMALLHTLCRCITFAEWRVRYTGTPMSCCAALSSSTLFSYCRFYIPPALLHSRLSLLLNSHGAVLSALERDASHIIYKPAIPTAGNEASGSGTNSSSSSSVSSSSSSSGDSSLIHSDEDEEGSEAEEESTLQGPAPAANKPLTNGAAADDATSVTAVDSGSPRGLEEPPTSFSLPQPTQAKKAVANPYAAHVTEQWVMDCCKALRVLPVVPPTRLDELSELMRTTGTLMTVMLPPEDAKPLLFDQFLHIAQTHRYNASVLTAGCTSSAEVQQKLVSLFKDTARIRFMVPDAHNGSAAHLRSGGGKAVLSLCRHERKRDKDSVASHLQLVASQLTYSMDAALREYRQERSREGGTQTCSARYATVSTNTEIVEIPVKKIRPRVALPPPPQTPPTAGITTAEQVNSVDDDTDGKKDAEWRSHLKNVEGKLLRSRRQASPEEPPVPNGGVEAKAHDDRAVPPHNNNSASSILPLPPPSQSPSSFGSPPTLSIFSAPRQPPPPQPQPPGHAPPRNRSIFPMPGDDLVRGSPVSFGGGASSPPSASSPASTNHYAGLTQCLVPTTDLPQKERDQLFAFLKSLPMFSADPKTFVQLLSTGVLCCFATQKEAESFAKLEYIQCDTGNNYTIIPQFPLDHTEARQRPLMAAVAPHLPPQRPSAASPIVGSDALYSGINATTVCRPQEVIGYVIPAPAVPDAAGEPPASSSYDGATTKAEEQQRRVSEGSSRRHRHRSHSRDRDRDRSGRDRHKDHRRKRDRSKERRHGSHERSARRARDEHGKEKKHSEGSSKRRKK